MCSSSGGGAAHRPEGQRTTACRFYDSIGATVNEDLASPGHKHEYREFLL
jgi:hypothetical protein